jgi:glycine cleavage system regulatory protein
MNVSLVMTIIGEDKPGLVDAVASTVTEHGGNWLESRMSRLGGQFAGILRVEIPEQKEKSFLDSLKQLENKGLKIITQKDRSLSTGTETPEMILEIVGQDRPGIVRQISHTLARYGVNVEDLHTETSSAPMSGDLLFHARAEIRIPSSCPINELRNELEKIAADLMVDFSLGQRETTTS